MVDAYAGGVRRDELAALGIQLPVLPTIVLGPLPGRPDWSARLARIGLDVTASGADEDTCATLAAARQAAPHLAMKARIADAGALDGHRAMIVETEGPTPPHLYRLSSDDEIVVAVDAGEAVEDVMDIARNVLGRARRGSAAALWVATATGMDRLPREVVEAKLAILVEGVRQARLYLAKEQFEI
jgi:hypothetical protein